MHFRNVQHFGFLNGIKELTRGVLFQSGPPTPTRALSAAHPSQADKSSISASSHEEAERSGTRTPRPSPTTGGQAPPAKGKLTIKIPEARGLRSCRDPYVVVVFQRSELISGGPRISQEEDTLSVEPSRFGGVPIQRQGSDSGRIPMSIPMRSRQSSNTSNGDSKPARPRPGRTSFTNPQWDAEAIL
jgi:serine/threonine protein kinase SCH9